MRLMFGSVLILGVGLAGYAVYSARSFISSNEEELQQVLATRVAAKPIYVAAVPLRYGQELLPEHVRLVKFPEESMPEGVFLDEAGLFPNANASPRTVLRAIEVNEPILATKVTEPGESAGVATALSPGMRAFTIDVNAETGVSGFLSPGDRVDVTWTGTVDNRQFSKIIQSSLKVIAIDQSADEDRLDPPAVANTVTVEVSPEVVAALAQARSTGLLSLSLVGALETTQATDVEVDQGTLLGIEQVVEEAPEEAEVCTVRRGVEIVEVPCP